ncbi:thioesterase family protein [Sphingobium sp. WTD-1]|jgi:hypothetical protein|uniref:thioesterase family protein n=1 Tax=Sphingobium sp. WTD-1 TaxID=2979467 RepID=UPI0024DEFCC7|nr:thioesterase family protein [Sphingobium sp. WTD-1]WIA57184.1 thioesterase family protein [Sphingobium sp. WTD-1]
MAYFQRIDDRHFVPTEHVGGAWNIAEQHVAPAFGLLAHAIERDGHLRRADPLQLGRLSYDILGTINLAPVRIDVTLLRPGRTIELVEARLVQNDRPAIILRAWLAAAYDTAAIAGTGLSPIPGPETMAPWDGTGEWPGGFIASIDAHRQSTAPGRAIGWIRTPHALIEDEAVSPLARAMGLVDTANGLAPLVSTADAAFPNLDLTAHIFRAPAGEWVGFDVSVSFGADGIGLTHTILHDRNGPLGTVSQWLTIRPR